MTITATAIVLGHQVLLEMDNGKDKIFTINETFQDRIVNYIKKNKIILQNKQSFTWGDKI